MVETRLDNSWYIKEFALIEMCKRYGYDYRLIEDNYFVDVVLRERGR